MTSSSDYSYINSIIGEGTSFKGDIKLNGLFRIDGDFKGNIVSDGKVLVGKSGRAECDIKASTVVIGGLFKGNIDASERIAILSSGLVIGNIRAPRFEIEEDVIFHGRSVITKNTKEAMIKENFKSESQDTSSYYAPKKDINQYNPANYPGR